MMNVENEDDTKVKKFEITVSDKATYVIESTSEELAIDQAIEFFNEREPKIIVEDVTNIPTGVYKDIKKLFKEE